MARRARPLKESGTILPPAGPTLADPSFTPVS